MSDNILKNAYINGLEPQFKNIALQMFEDNKPIEEIYRHISKLRYPRGKIIITRSLTTEERKFLAKLSSDLRKKAFNSLMKGEDFAIVKKQIEHEQNRLEILSLKKDTIKQAIKTVLKMQALGFLVPLNYYELIIDWDVLVSMDYELFGKMALVMLNTYSDTGNGENYQNVRSFMFNKIEECFDRGIIPHPHIFDFMFKGGWISEKTFMILHLHAQDLIDAGMGGKLVLPLERMYEERKKDQDPQHPFSVREGHYFQSLINLFQKKM